MSVATPFTPVAATLGGLLIGAAAVALWWAVGRIAGVSGIAAGWWREDRAWRGAFLAGLVAGAGLLAAFGVPAPVRAGASPLLLVAAGLLVGYGTSLANGCTSGHGVCGLARGSLRSLAAVAVFLGCGIATVALLRQLGAGP